MRLAAVAVAVAACGIDTAPVEPTTEAPAYRDVVELFDQGIARTCALNNGVCHNSNSYPDLHTVENVLATLDRPCNVDVTEPQQINDACEPPADRFAIAAIDARIVRAAFLPEDRDAPAPTQVTLTLDPPPTGLAPNASGLAIRRGATAFEVRARIASVTGADVVLDLRTADPATKQFFDVRAYPPGPLRLHVGDPNGNGVEGAIGGSLPLIAAGDPDGSYLLRRLVDDSFGELMPRQCRTWDDRANRALACWIAGLAPDAANAYDPIDYAGCPIDVAGRGKCKPD